jgi:redox-sensitive bicupin YhaK (pirin superfamily)
VISPARTYTPLVCADAVLAEGASTRLPFRPDFEYAVLALDGTVQVDGNGEAEPVELAPGPLLYLGSGRTELLIGADAPARLLLLGGEPFEEQLVMWWNFVGRSHEDIVQAREDWQAGVGFGQVTGFDGDRLPAPAMPGTTLRPRGRER